MQDLRKWEKATFTAQPPETVSKEALSFSSAPERALPVMDNKPLPWALTREGERVHLGSPPPEGLVRWGKTLQPLSPTLYSFGKAGADVDRAVYIGDTLAREGAVGAREVPDGQRARFSFGDAGGPILLDDEVVDENEYTLSGDDIVFASPPSFGSDLRRVSGDYAVLDADAGEIVFAEPPRAEVRVAESVVRLAEVLEGETDGTNRRFRFERDNVFVNDEERAVFVDDRRLSDKAERPEERVDGVREVFTFESGEGIITVDDVPLEEGEDYRRDGHIVLFSTPPPRNARVRQYLDFFLTDPKRGEITLAVALEGGSTVWTSRYTVYTKPGCGAGVLECFYALPQHPVPFPHWIAERVPAFLSKFPLTDERNVLRATLYTSLGTLAALGLGGAVGILLAVLFVLFRPLERALLPWTIASQTVPIIALVPVLLLILGNVGITIQTSLLPTAIIGAYIAFFPVVVGTVKGLRSVDPLALDLMKSYAATPLQVFMKVRFPAAVPFFFTSLKLGTAAALVGALVAETESNNRRGLGFQILGQVQSGNVADVWILLIISGLLGIGLVALVGGLQRFLAPWERT